MLNENFNLKTPLPYIFPKIWKNKIGQSDNMLFRNLDHFKNVVSGITQKIDNKCGISYKDALDKMIRGESDIVETNQISIRNLVRSNLYKRGLISDTVYEHYKYTVDGIAVGVDVGKYVSGEPDCVITPTKQYVDFFYELYINISYPYKISNEDVLHNTIKLLTTIEELERQHIFIKITLIFPAIDVTRNSETNYFSAIPLFFHKEVKSVHKMSSILNERLLRKFYFAILENLYGADLNDGYGTALSLDTSMNIGYEFNEIEFFENICKQVGL